MTIISTLLFLISFVFIFIAGYILGYAHGNKANEKHYAKALKGMSDVLTKDRDESSKTDPYIVG